MKNDSRIQWEHSHNFGIDSKLHENKVKLVFWLTTVIMVLEITAGTWSGSMALLADGWHMGTHSAAFLIAIFAYSYAKKHANNKDFSFGTGKVNSLGGFASAIALAIVALMMIIESVQRLIEPQSIHFNEAIVVAIIGLVVNVASVFILHDDHHHHGEPHHHHDHDHNMKAAYFHVLADTLTSLLAIVALLVGKYIGLLWMDPLMGIVGAIVIFRWSYGLVKESSEVLLDKSVKKPTLDKISDALSKKNTVINDIHVWKIATGHQAAILKVTSGEPLKSEEYEIILKSFLPQLSHISIEIRS
ncbi:MULTISPECIES: CDF family Co(II)/Ni(II) efflux transporter DmeF [Alteromonadales]|jgi:cation diffusion facilitator family transporter|nr:MULTISPECIES: CDF family Co(II)/Ni(II) efflux transporter DmeF [Alteromonadales]MBL1386327.1 CDF family Co(II)/Ni(II) efflux transporter DmeF [Colwellia sp.]HCP98397.1 cation transporter [Pseudoalteromonas sp.]TMP50728.1 cation transporter [Pseudoalteromonas sp. S1688]TMS80789.1 cation transporter [Pseudoalteromonas sp. S554]GAA73928.1 cation efflux system protein, CDF family [Pseudoalteromonas sp. BSi20480]|tara:strand:+ start:9687 stop:10592 length:906 start_codon:yes stop_codon:yes gene_type:complete